MSAPRVAVLGATGAVGSAAVAMLRRLGITTLRAGARGAAVLGTGPDAVQVDAWDTEALRRFCAGTALVLNCAGPSYLLLDRVARAAFEAGAHYVDVSGDGPAHGLLTSTPPPAGRIAVLSAGMLPGLGNVLVRSLAARGPHDGRLLVHSGGIEGFTRTAAADLVLSLRTASGESFAAWRRGRVPNALRIIEDTELPYFTGLVTALPYLGVDTERLARDLGLSEVDWFNVFSGGSLRTALASLRDIDCADAEALRSASEAVTRSAQLDLLGRQPYYLMTFALSAGDASRTAVVRTASSFRLTAAVGALTVQAVLDGLVLSGLHYADEVLAAEPLIDGIRALDAVQVLDVHTSERSGELLEDGAL